MLVHPHQAWSDASRVQRLAREGWLGFEHDSWALFSFTGKLWDGLGPALVVAVVGLALALRRRSRTDLILAAFVLAYLVDLLTIRAHFDRYVLPLVPALAALAGRQRLLAPLTLACLIVPLVWAIGDDVRLTRTDTRARRARLDRAARPAERDRRRRVLDSAARGPSDRRARAARDRSGRSTPIGMSPACEDEGVRYVLVTGAIADRVLAARDQYPREARFYDELRTRAKRVYHVEPGHGLTGPWVSLYRL